MVYIYIGSFIGFFTSVISMAEMASVLVLTALFPFVDVDDCDIHSLLTSLLSNLKIPYFGWTVSLGQRVCESTIPEISELSHR